MRFTDADLDVRPLRHAPRRPTASSRHGIEVAVEGTGPLLAHVGAHLVAVGPPRRGPPRRPPTLEERFLALTTPEDPR